MAKNVKAKQVILIVIAIILAGVETVAYVKEINNVFVNWVVPLLLLVIVFLALKKSK